MHNHLKIITILISSSAMAADKPESFPSRAQDANGKYRNGDVGYVIGCGLARANCIDVCAELHDGRSVSETQSNCTTEPKNSQFKKTGRPKAKQNMGGSPTISPSSTGAK